MRVIFMGTPDFSVGTLEEIIKAGHEVVLVVSQPDKAVGRSKAHAFDENMEEYEIEGTELMARAICHELDHLDGHMYTEIVEGPLHDVTYDDPEE